MVCFFVFLFYQLILSHIYVLTKGECELSHMRQDAWSEAEDQQLARITLAYIKEGKTQLEAFKEVGNQLNRTSAACGFRWNATIRKLYEEEILQAKNSRNAVIPETSQEIDENPIETAILYLKKMQENDLSPYSDRVTESIRELEKENETLKIRLAHYEVGFERLMTIMNQLELNNGLISNL